MFTDFEAAKAWIEHSKRFGDKLDLSRMQIAADMLDHPERTFKSVHVGGTNGKGSTANFIKNIMMEAGFKVGLYTSPYIVKFNERIMVNNQYIDNDDVITYANRLKTIWDDIYENHGDSVTFFELLTLMAFMYFRDQGVSYAIVEVGLGGTLDATNIIQPEVALITNISYDHMKQLGNTLESIALNKLGIVKQRSFLITSIENKALFPLFYEIVHKKDSRIKIIDFNQVQNQDVSVPTTFTYRGEHYEIGLVGHHQIKNACLAIEAIRTLRLKTKTSISEQNIKDGLLNTQWPGRFEIFDKRIILDGAHNIGAVRELIRTLDMVYPDKNIRCLFCMMHDKEHSRIISELDNIVEEFVFTEFPYPRCADAKILYAESNHQNKQYNDDAKEAFSNIRDTLKDDEILLVTGSLYFVSHIRQFLIR